MKRRDILVAGASAAGVVGVGVYVGQQNDGWLAECPPLVDDPPETIYRPSHRDGMEMLGVETVGNYGVGLAYTFPHPFWLVTGEEREFVEPGGDDEIHLMAVVWDAETETVLPIDTGPTIEVTDADGAHVDERAFWPMLSQSMGYHFGENLAIPDAGEYAAHLSLPAMETRRTGAFEGRFEERETVEIEFSFDPDDVTELACDATEHPGEPGAIEPMEMEMLPLSTVGPTDELPGQVLGTASAGDAGLTTVIVDEQYLAVVARTPYNDYPLPAATLSARIVRDGEPIVEDSLRETLDSELGFHYGLETDGIQSGDEIELSIDTPPQIARHAGYQNAFVDRPSATLTVP